MSTHAIGERFVLLDETITPLDVPLTNIGQDWTIRAVTFGDSLNHGVESNATIAAQSLKPYSPVHALAKKNMFTGDIVISWIRRARIDHGMRDFVDVPLVEQSELYELEILNGANVVRSWRVTTPLVEYLAAQQLADFSTSPPSLTLRVVQISALVGPGTPLLVTLPVL
jgi:hypothetical protein